MIGLGQGYRDGTNDLNFLPYLEDKHHEPDRLSNRRIKFIVLLRKYVVPPIQEAGRLRPQRAWFEHLAAWVLFCLRECCSAESETLRSRRFSH